MPNNRIVEMGLIHEDAQSRVLRFLWRSRNEWSGREIARQVGLSAPSCHETLKKLDARGLVRLRRISNVHLYGINADSYLVQNAFAPFFAAEEAMPGEIEALVKRTLAAAPHNGVLSIVIRGTMSEEAEKPGLDALVVLRGKKDAETVEPRVEDLRLLLSRRFNLALTPRVRTASDLRGRLERRLPAVQEILRDGRTVYGKDLKELLS